MKKYSFLLGFLALVVGCQSEVNNLTEQPETLFARSGPPVSGSSENDPSSSGNGGGEIPHFWSTIEYFDQNNCGREIKHVALSNDTGKPIYIKITGVHGLGEYSVDGFSYADPVDNPSSDDFVRIFPGSSISILLNIVDREPNSTVDYTDLKIVYAYTYILNPPNSPPLIKYEATRVRDFRVCPD